MTAQAGLQIVGSTANSTESRQLSSIVALDIIFAEPSTVPAADAALAAALGPDVTLAGDETLIKTPHADQTMRIEPLPEFLAAGARTGLKS